MPMTSLRKAPLAAVASLLLALATRPAEAAAPLTRILFVGNSFTHGRYDPVRNFGSGYDAGPFADLAPHVHDLLCPSPDACAAGESALPNDADAAPFPADATTVAAKLDFLADNPSLQYVEAGPFGGIPGIFLRFAQELGFRYDVSLVAVSAATLDGRSFAGDPANSALIGSAAWDRVVLQDQSFEPLPSTVLVRGKPVATRGDQTAFAAGVTAIVGRIDSADAAAGRPPIPVTLYETEPLASYGYASRNPDEPIYGSSTTPPGGVDAPYVGAADPIGQMASDLHNAYAGEASSYDAAHPTGSALDVALSGDAWVSAIRVGVARADPFRRRNSFAAVDLWDADPLDACCTAPIGYHPSPDGAYLSALVLFGRISGASPLRLGRNDGAAAALGIPPAIAVELQWAAALTIALGHPVPRP